MKVGEAEQHHWNWTWDELHWFYIYDLKVRCRYRYFCENQKEIMEAISAIKLGYVTHPTQDGAD